MRSVLVVDDNELQRVICRNLLKQLGIVVVGAPDGLQAIREIDDPKNMFGAIITDFHMPIMNGLLFATTLRSKPCRLPIFLSTSDTDIVARFSTDPVYSVFEGILPKPVIPLDLFEKISRSLQRNDLTPAELELSK